MYKRYNECIDRDGQITFLEMNKMKKEIIKNSNELTKAKFYTFPQNNSGGSFVVDEEAGIAETVIIEAHSADDANFRAERIGIYFNGVDSDMDCECCGDRWCETDEGQDVPSYYGTPIENLEPSWYRNRFFIHMLDGSIIKVELD